MIFEHNLILVFAAHIISLLIAVFFAVLIVFHDWRSYTNKVFFLLMASVGLLAVTNFLTFVIVNNLSLIKLLIRLQMVLATLQLYGGLAFVYLFPDGRLAVTKKWLGVLVAVLFGVSLAASPFLFVFTDELWPGTHVPITTSSPLNPVWGIIAGIISVATLFIGFKKWRQAEPGRKKPFGAILAGVIATLILNFVTQYLFLNVFKIIDLNFYYPIFLLPLVLGTGYAVIRHHLLNIKAVATELLIFSLWMFLVIRLFFEKSLGETVVDLVILGGVVFIGIFLIKSVLNEVRQKERLAELNAALDKTNAELKDLNEHLEQKVAEQTVEIRRAYEVEKRARMELEELDKAKDQFILTTQHHLRTPLTITKGYLQAALEDNTTKLSPQLKNYLVKAQDATERIASLVNELLDIAQMEVGQNLLNRKPVRLNDLFQDILQELAPEIEKKKLTVEVNLPPDFTLSLDPEKMKAALTNIIDNAVKYNQPGGRLTITGLKTVHPIERSQNIYRLTIADTGIGLSPEELSKLFTRYFERGEEAQKIYTTGRGIGLVVTKNIIEAHGGKIWAESEGRGRGSRFMVELPVAQ